MGVGGRKYAQTWAKERCGGDVGLVKCGRGYAGGVGMVMGERGGRVVGADDGRGRAVCS